MLLVAIIMVHSTFRDWRVENLPILLPPLTPESRLESGHQTGSIYAGYGYLPLIGIINMSLNFILYMYPLSYDIRISCDVASFTLVLCTSIQSANLLTFDIPTPLCNLLNDDVTGCGNELIRLILIYH